MNYETVRDLHAAGFNLISIPYEELDDHCRDWVHIGDLFYAFPTLSELIAECGGDIKRIEKKRTLWHAVEADECCDDPQDRFGYCKTSGPTPEIAVAKLYIALNKK